MLLHSHHKPRIYSMWLFNNVLSSQSYSLNNESIISTKVFSTVITRISILIYLLWSNDKNNLYFVQTMDWTYFDVSRIQDRMCLDYNENKGTNIFRNVSSSLEKKYIPHCIVAYALDIHCNSQVCTKIPLFLSDAQICFDSGSKRFWQTCT